MEVNLVAKVKWCNQLFMIDGQNYARSQGLTEKNWLYIVGPVEEDGLYVVNKVVLKVFWIVCPVTTLRLTYSLF